MPATHLSKFIDRQTDGHGGRLYWNRVDLDGLPYRHEGAEPPPWLTTEEADDRLVERRDAHVREFRLWDPQDAAEYQDLLDLVVNGLAVLTSPREFGEVVYTRPDPEWPGGTITEARRKVYVEWALRSMTDGRPMAAQRPYLAQPNDD